MLADIGSNSFVSKRLQWLGLVENPYLPYPDGRYFLPLAEQRLAYQDITAIITEKSPSRNVCVIMGEPGSGKSALAQRLVSAAFHGSYLSAIGVLLGKDDATPAKMGKQILATLGAAPIKAIKDRLPGIRVELEQRMIVLNESVFLAFDTDLGDDSAAILDEMIQWEYQGKSLVQAAIFVRKEAFLNMKDLVSKASVIRTLSAPSVRELAGLVNTLTNMAGRSTPLFTDTALELLIERSHRNLGELMLLADRALQVLIQQSEADIIDNTIMESL